MNVTDGHRTTAWPRLLGNDGSCTEFLVTCNGNYGLFCIVSEIFNVE